MKQFTDYFLVVICSLAAIIALLQAVKTAFQPKWMKHPVFEFPADRLRRTLLLLCAIGVMLFVIVDRLGYIETCR